MELFFVKCFFMASHADTTWLPGPQSRHMRAHCSEMCQVGFNDHSPKESGQEEGQTDSYKTTLFFRIMIMYVDMTESLKSTHKYLSYINSHSIHTWS